jgi:hypothetical protein
VPDTSRKARTSSSASSAAGRSATTAAGIGPSPPFDLEFCCEDEADAQQLYGKLRDALPKRFKVKASTSASIRD